MRERRVSTRHWQKTTVAQIDIFFSLATALLSRPHSLTPSRGTHILDVLYHSGKRGRTESSRKARERARTAMQRLSLASLEVENGFSRFVVLSTSLTTSSSLNLNNEKQNRTARPPPPGPPAAQPPPRPRSSLRLRRRRLLRPLWPPLRPGTPPRPPLRRSSCARRLPAPKTPPRVPSRPGARSPPSRRRRRPSRTSTRRRRSSSTSC